MTHRDVAWIVERRDEAAFVDLLRAADAELDDSAFEPALADALRADVRDEEVDRYCTEHAAQD